MPGLPPSYIALQGQIEVIGQKLSGVQSAGTALVMEVAAAVLQTPPGKIIILWDENCPPGYYTGPRGAWVSPAP